MADELLSGTVTFLFTDIEGSTQLVQRLRDGYADVLRTHGGLLREAFDAHGGQVVDTQGDAFFAVFGRAKEAVEAAVAAQRALAGYEWPGDRSLVDAFPAGLSIKEITGIPNFSARRIKRSALR